MSASSRPEPATGAGRVGSVLGATLTRAGHQVAAAAGSSAAARQPEGVA